VSGEKEMRAMIFSDMARTQPKCLHCRGGRGQRGVDSWRGWRSCASWDANSARRLATSKLAGSTAPVAVNFGLRLFVALYVPDSQAVQPEPWASSLDESQHHRCPDDCLLSATLKEMLV